MSRKGNYTNKYIKVNSDFVKIGKISGYNGYGEPVYDLLSIHNENKIGEMGNQLIKQKKKDGFMRNYY